MSQTLCIGDRVRVNHQQRPDYVDQGSVGTVTEIVHNGTNPAWGIRWVRITREIKHPTWGNWYYPQELDLL